MSQLFKNIVTVLAVAAFATLVAVMAYSAGQQADPAAAVALPPAYPPLAYAMQQAKEAPPPTATPVPVWLTYSGEETGFTFQYRSDFRLTTGRYPDRPFGEVHISVARGETLNIRVLENPDQLPLELFLHSYEGRGSILNSSTPWPEGGVRAFAEPLTVAGREALGFESHRDLVSKIGMAGYAIFIPFEAYVVEAAFGSGGPTPSNGPRPFTASPVAMERTLIILDTIQLLERE